jgi:hypothetical protein
VTEERTEEPGEDPDKPTIAPFVGALAIVVLVVIGIVVVNKFTGGDPTVDQTITQVVIGQNDALQREDYQKFVLYTCRGAQGDEAGVMAAQKESAEKNGGRFVDEVTNIRVNGEQATATVTYSFEKSRDDKTPTEVPLVGEDGAWKVCEV